MAHFNTYQKHTHDGAHPDVTFWFDPIDVEIMLDALDVYMHDDAAIQDVSTPILASRLSVVLSAALEYMDGDGGDDDEEDA